MPGYHAIQTVLHRIAIAILLLSMSAYIYAADVAQLRQQAAAGDREAQFQLAQMFYRGEGVSRNYVAALKWYRAAAEQGHAEAQYQMGYLHQHGPSLVKKDNHKAFEWYLKAAKQGNVSAQTKVSLMYATGKGVEKNMALSRKWSTEVLKSKGFIDDSTATPAARPRSKAVSQKPVKQKVPAQKPSKPVAGSMPRPVSGSKTRAASGKKAKPVDKKSQMTPAEYKAWRREQARKLVEKMNREAAETGDWSDVE